MRRKEKAAFGCIMALLLACLLSVGVAYFTGWLTHIKNAAVLPFKAQSLLNLANQYPFTPPEGAGVTEERLMAYLEVCCRVKPVADELDAWEEVHQQQRLDKKKDMKMKAAGHVAAYMEELAEALEEHQMGPTEFRWIGDRMRLATAGPQETIEAEMPSDSAKGSDMELCILHSERLETCALGPHSLRIADDFAGN